VQDDYEPYKDGAETDPLVEVKGAQYKVLRGGSWYVGPEYVRASERDRGGPGDRDPSIGFRCVGEFR
jgi:formylglycine-generating enzyme required for sulfatase activity